MTIVTLEDGSFVDLKNLENIQNKHQLDAIGPTPHRKDDMLECKRPCDRVHVYDYYQLEDSVNEAPPAYCRVEKPSPDYAGLDLSCSPQQQDASSHKPLQIQPRESIPQDYDPFISFHTNSFEAYNPSLKRKFPRRTGPSCLKCWMLREKCVGKLPCDRCIAKDRSTALYLQPCITASLSAFDFNVFYPHLQTQSLKRLHLSTIRHGSTAKDVPFSELLNHKAIIFRLIVLSSKLNTFLKQSSRSSLFIKFPVSSTIIRHFSQLNYLNLLISKTMEHISSISDYAYTSMFVLVMLEARAITLHNLLKALERLMKLKLRSAPSDAPDLFCAFLFLASSEIEVVGDTCERFKKDHTATAPEGVIYPTTTISSLVDHLCRWLQFFSLEILNRRGHIDILKDGNSVELSVGRVLQIGRPKESAENRYQHPPKLSILHDAQFIREIEGAEAVDLWTGDVLDTSVEGQQEIPNERHRAAVAIDGLVGLCRGPLKSETTLHLDRVTRCGGSYFDFASREFHQSQTSGNDNTMFNVCDSELLEFPKFTAAMNHIFGSI